MLDVGCRMLDVGCRIELNRMLSYPILSYPAKHFKISFKRNEKQPISVNSLFAAFNI